MATANVRSQSHRECVIRAEDVCLLQVTQLKGNFTKCEGKLTQTSEFEDVNLTFRKWIKLLILTDLKQDNLHLIFTATYHTCC